MILSGAGVYDGSEVHETVLTLLALDQRGVDVQCFAPNMQQSSVIDHITGQEGDEQRNVLVESARLTRGKVKDLAQFDASMFDALILPGGFGAAKNLSSFAQDGADCHVQRDVDSAIRAMHDAGKPIGALCIAPVLLARVLGKVALTIGTDAGIAAAITEMGASHQRAGHGEVVIDRANKVVTSPCYMLEATLSQIWLGVDTMVAALLDLVTAP